MYVKITHSGLASGIQLVLPCLHTVGYNQHLLPAYPRDVNRLHKGVIDGDDEDLASLLEVGVVDV